MEFENLVNMVLGLAGITAAIAMLVNAGKTAGIVKDGQASNVATVLEILFIIYAYVSQALGWTTNIQAVDQFLKVISDHSVVLMPLIIAGMSWFDGVVHKVMVGFPVIGKQLSVPNPVKEAIQKVISS